MLAGPERVLEKPAPGAERLAPVPGSSPAPGGQQTTCTDGPEQRRELPRTPQD